MEVVDEARVEPDVRVDNERSTEETVKRRVGGSREGVRRGAVVFLWEGGGGEGGGGKER